MTIAGTVSARVGLQFNLTTQYSAVESPSTGQFDVPHSAFNKSVSFNPTSTPPGSAVYSEELTSSQTLDLTALARTLEDTMDLSGLKLQALLLNNLSTANTVVLADTGANTYVVNAGAAITVQPGASIALVLNDKLTDVDATHKVLTLTATAGQKFQLAMLFG